jgi:predicted cupin superfamily sugar epimerase
MHAGELIASLNLAPHPEGGHYREIFRSPVRVIGAGSRERSALTTILFLLRRGEISRWHRVTADECWSFVEGDPLTLLQLDPAFDSARELAIGHPAPDRLPVHIVPAGHWQAAVPQGDFTLCTCSVGPGFDFADFTLLNDDHQERVRLLTFHPTLSRLL